MLGYGSPFHVQSATPLPMPKSCANRHPSPSRPIHVQPPPLPPLLPNSCANRPPSPPPPRSPKHPPKVFCELVKGLGESLVSGMVPGSSIAFAARKDNLDAPQTLSYASKSEGMFVRESLIFRCVGGGRGGEPVSAGRCFVKGACAWSLALAKF